ncbi:MAG: hypothetical protein V5A72_02640 [Candidatus Nanohaloarchaea archaeon]
MVDPSNETYGVHKIQDLNISGQEFNGTELSTWETEFSELFIQNLGGSYELTGVLALLFMGGFLYKQDAGIDTSAALMLPATLFMAYQGFLPYGEGITFAALLGATGIGIFGIWKYATR